MFRHILIPLDGSLRAEQAIPVAARLARASEGVHWLWIARPFKVMSIVSFSLVKWIFSGVVSCSFQIIAGALEKSCLIKTCLPYLACYNKIMPQITYAGALFLYGLFFCVQRVFKILVCLRAWLDTLRANDFAPGIEANLECNNSRFRHSDFKRFEYLLR